MNKILELISPYRKALVPVVIAGALALLAKVGITENMTVKEVVGLVVTAAAVYQIPNKIK